MGRRGARTAAAPDWTVRPEYRMRISMLFDNPDVAVGAFRASRQMQTLAVIPVFGIGLCNRLESRADSWGSTFGATLKSKGLRLEDTLLLLHYCPFGATLKSKGLRHTMGAIVHATWTFGATLKSKGLRPQGLHQFLHRIAFGATLKSKGLRLLSCQTSFSSAFWRHPEVEGIKTFSSIFSPLRPNFWRYPEVEGMRNCRHRRLGSAVAGR